MLTASSPQDTREKASDGTATQAAIFLNFIMTPLVLERFFRL
ncbi:hypothetical protein HMPREF0043_01743 [Actinobaculum sp. oral taxon 183 str. F0552]|nr:hypothetical protein HMPREF0043_01743 [Actinobaculum sp. oral taxon 183 str. F0552]